MSLLVIMEIRCKFDGEVIGFEYSFVDYVIKEYSGQDHVPEIAVIQLAIDTVQYHHPATKSSSFGQIMQVVLSHKN